MTAHFQTHGRALLARGHLIVPIKPGHKRPALDNWQSARLGAPDLLRFNGCGVGVLCGQGAHPLAALDIDTTHAELAERFAAWCHDTLGATVERVGAAPKTLLVYRAAAEGWGKATGAWFVDADGGKHRLEVLGKGQQFVAYHVHPDTGRPYQWTDLFGGLDALRADDLPALTAEQVADALATFERMAQDAGLTRLQRSATRAPGMTAGADADNPLATFEPPVGLGIDDARALLRHVDNEDYDTWLRVGMSLHHEFDASDDALALWDTWSSTASNYAGLDDLAARWASFGHSGRAPMTARWLLKAGREGASAAELAEKRGALDEAKAAIAACADSIALVNVVAVDAGRVAGDDLALRAELAGLLRARFKDLTGTALAIADVRAAMAAGRPVPLPSAQSPRRAMTEFGNTDRLLDQYGAGLMYVPELDAWHKWDGVYWRRAYGVELAHLAKETIRALPGEAGTIDGDGERAAFFRFCALSQSAAMVERMVSLAQSDPRVVVGVANLDPHSHLLGVANGAVDLRTGRLLAPDPALRITMSTGVEYDPAAKAPLWEATLLDIFNGDVEQARFLQRLMGYALLGRPREAIMVVPFGTGQNGKSTVFEVLAHVFGDYARTAAAETFMDSRGGGGNAGGAREDLLRLRGARLVYVGEPEEGAVLREAFVKSMTGGEAIPARGVYGKHTVEVVPTWLAVMPTNHKPIVKGDDHAIWRRLLTMPYLRNFDTDPTVKRDGNRRDKLRGEAPGIQNWLVQGGLDYQRDGLNPPAAVTAAREQYRADMDLLRSWLDECCDVGPDYADTSAALWASWESFARQRGELRFVSSWRALSARLASRFKQAQHVPGRNGARGFIGLRVRDGLV